MVQQSFGGEPAHQGPGEPVRIATVDLSEGGIRCVTRDGATLAAGDAFEATLDLAGDRVDVQAELIRSHHLGGRGWELALRFVGLHWRDEDRIRRFVYARQARAHAHEAP